MKPTVPIINYNDPISKGILGAWLFTEGIGTRINDSSGFKNVVTTEGTTTWINTDDGPYLDFVPDAKATVQAASFRSSVKRVLRPVYKRLPFLPAGWIGSRSSVTFYGTDYISVAAWVISDTDVALNTAVSRWDVKNRVFILGHGAVTGSYRFSIYIGNTFLFAESTTGFSIGVKHLLLGTYDGQNIKLYVDGALVATTPTTGVIDKDPVDLVIGGRAEGGNAWDGKIGTAIVWNRALDSEEATWLYTDIWRPFRYVPFFTLIPSLSIAATFDVAARTRVAHDISASGPSITFWGVAVRTRTAERIQTAFKQSNVIFAFDETYQILSADIDDTRGVANLQVGQFNIFKVKFPRNIYNDSRCEWVYKSEGFCDYGSDHFEGLSQVDFKLTGEGDSGIQGWRAQNVTAAPILAANINITNPGFLTLKIAAGTAIRYDDFIRNAPYIYRTFPANDVDFEVLTAGDGNENVEEEGILITSDSDVATGWLTFSTRIEGGIRTIVATIAEGGTTESTVFSGGSLHRFLRVQKVTTDLDEQGTRVEWKFYSKATAIDSYGTPLKVSSVNAPSLDTGNIRVGLYAATSTGLRSTDFNAKFDFIRLLAGGIPSCDRTLKGVNGCSVHNNTRRFGGAPSILRGPLQL